MNRLNDLTTSNSCFRNFDELLNAGGDYRPTIDCSDADRLELADAYDAAQAKRNDPRRAFRSRDPLNAANRSRREYETKMHNSMNAIRRDADAMNRDFDLDNEELIMSRKEIEQEIKNIERDLRDTIRGERRFGTDFSVVKGIMQRSLEGMQRLLKRAPFESAAHLAQTAVSEARATIKSCRNDRNRFEFKTHFTHRGVDLIAINSDGERCDGESPIFLDLKEVNGRALKDAAKYFIANHGDDCVEISVQGGVDAHESLALFLEDHRNGGCGDYDPQVEEWEVSAPISLFS